MLFKRNSPTNNLVKRYFLIIECIFLVVNIVKNLKTIAQVRCNSHNYLITASGMVMFFPRRPRISSPKALSRVEIELYKFSVSVTGMSHLIFEFYFKKRQKCICFVIDCILEFI